MASSNVEKLMERAMEMLADHEKAGTDEVHLKPLRELKAKRDEGHTFTSEQEILAYMVFGDPQAGNKLREQSEH